MKLIMTEKEKKILERYLKRIEKEEKKLFSRKYRKGDAKRINRFNKNK